MSSEIFFVKYVFHIASEKSIAVLIEALIILVERKDYPFHSKMCHSNFDLKSFSRYSVSWFLDKLVITRDMSSKIFFVKHILHVASEKSIAVLTEALIILVKRKDYPFHSKMCHSNFDLKSFSRYSVRWFLDKLVITRDMSSEIFLVKHVFHVASEKSITVLTETSIVLVERKGCLFYSKMPFRLRCFRSKDLLVVFCLMISW